MPAYRLTLEYDGSGYAGWQRQPRLTTVEGALRAAIEAVCAEDPRLTAAGRTDAGAHSHGQVVGLHLSRSWDGDRLAAALNSELPDDIAVIDAAQAPDDFHARYDARVREYRYVVVPRRSRSPLTRRQAWTVSGPLDIDAMRRGGAILEGTHDFAAFGRPNNPGKTTMRNVYAVRVMRTTIHSAAEQSPLDAVSIEVSANAFIYGMMRSFAGALVALGQGKLTESDLRAMLASPHASHRHVTVAPAHGLHQWTVTYA